MWVALDLVDHAWQANLANTLANYLNENRIEPNSVVTISVTEKYFEGVGYQKDV